MSNPFSRESIQRSVRRVDFGVESEAGEQPEFTIDATGEHTFPKADLTWSAWAKTKWSKATTAVGAKVGLKW